MINSYNWSGSGSDEYTSQPMPSMNSMDSLNSMNSMNSLNSMNSMNSMYSMPYMPPISSGTPSSGGNYTMQPFGNQLPFSNSDLENISGNPMGMMMPPEILSGDMPETLTNPIYTPGFLREHLGQWMRIEFLIGNMLTDRVGRLVKVGASYVVLQSLDSGSAILGDIYAIKFVTIYNDPEIARMYSTT